MNLKMFGTFHRLFGLLQEVYADSWNLAVPLKFGSIDEARAYHELIVRRTTHLLGEMYARIMAAKMELGHAPTADSPGKSSILVTSQRCF